MFNSFPKQKAIALRQTNIIKNLNSDNLDNFTFESNYDGTWTVSQNDIPKFYNHYDLMTEYCKEGSFHSTQLADLSKLLSENNIPYTAHNLQITTSSHVYTMSDCDDFDYDSWYVTPLDANKESYNSIPHIELLTNPKYF